nr:hypothetical protein [uncultured archaeon]
MPEETIPKVNKEQISREDKCPPRVHRGYHFVLFFMPTDLHYSARKETDAQADEDSRDGEEKPDRSYQDVIANDDEHEYEDGKEKMQAEDQLSVEMLFILLDHDNLIRSFFLCFLVEEKKKIKNLINFKINIHLDRNLHLFRGNVWCRSCFHRHYFGHTPRVPWPVVKTALRCVEHIS